MLYPDFRLGSMEELTPEFLSGNGIRGIVFDLDETLAPRSADAPSEQMRAHVETLRKSGLRMALVSNSRTKRVTDFCRDLELMIFPGAQKPRVRVLKRALKELGLPPQEVAMVGDQIFTDVIAGNRLGMATVMIAPLQDRNTRFFRFKRRMERIVLRRCEAKR